MRSIFLILIGLLVITGIQVRPAKAQADGQEISAEDVKQAMDRGISYLRREQQSDGSWPDHPGMSGGVTAIVTLALLNAGVPVNDPQIQKSLTKIRSMDLSTTYCVSLQTMVLAIAEPKRDLLKIKQNVRWLEETQIRDGVMSGGWDYSPTLGNGGDNSNSQFAVLALYEAERVGIPVNESTWRLAQDFWVKQQNNDGSWGYKPGMGGYGSMTAAGVASVIMCEDQFSFRDAFVDGDRIRCCGEQKSSSVVQDGLNWLAQEFSVHRNPRSPGEGWILYYLYGMERVGRLTNHRFIGKADWYREGVSMLMQAQVRPAGYWSGTGHGETNPNVGTSFALLFLAKGRRPVVVSKLEYDETTDWNHHRRDLANLVAYTETKWERELTWQIIDRRKSTPDDLMQTPVLFISGSVAHDWTDQDAANLREYINRGGFVLAEGCCENSSGFDESFRNLMERVFPEPEYRLRLLPPEHIIWYAEERVDAEYMRPLYGVDVGCRTSVVYAPEGLSCMWELSKPGRSAKFPARVQAEVKAAMSTGINILAYATNREVKYKLEIPRTLATATADDEFERAKLYVAQVLHSGGSEAAPGALPSLLRALSQSAGLRVSTDQREIGLGDPQLFDYHLLFLHGRNAFKFSDAEREQLKLFVERGGTVLADSVCASEQFTKSFRQEMAAIFPDTPLESIPAAHPMFTEEFGGFDLSKVSRREPQRAGEAGAMLNRMRTTSPDLEGVKINEQYRVIFSRFDLSCALERQESVECPGYTREDAARIGINAVLYMLHQ